MDVFVFLYVLALWLTGNLSRLYQVSRSMRAGKGLNLHQPLKGQFTPKSKVHIYFDLYLSVLI